MTPEKIKVRVTKAPDEHWYEKGEVYEVLNKIEMWVTVDGSLEAHFVRGENWFGIPVSNCEILNPLKEHTHEELEEILGYKFEYKK